MKNKHLTLIASLFSVFALASCGDKTVEKVTEGSVSKETVSEFKSITTDTTYDKQIFALSDYNVNLYLGGETSRKVSVTSIPASLGSSAVTFSSLDEDVATVASDGTITAQSKGITKIKVSANNEEVVEYVNVFVNEAADNNTAATRFQALAQATKDAAYTGVERFFTHEYTIQTLAADGEIYNSSEYVQDMKFSKSEAYFEIYSDDLYLKTPQGNKEYNNGKWIFFLDIDSFAMFLCHETTYSKTYMEVNCSAYLDDVGEGLMQEYEILYDLLDMFFVSGRKIITDTLDDIEGGNNAANGKGKGVYEDFADMLIKGYDNVNVNAGSPNGEDMAAKYIYTDTAKIRNDEEEDLCIPAGTEAQYILTDEICTKDGFIIGENYHAQMNYQIDIGKGMQNGERHFKKLTQNFTDFEIKKPDLKQYSLVTEIAKL